MIGPDELRIRESNLNDLPAAARVPSMIELAQEWSRLDKRRALRLADDALEVIATSEDVAEEADRRRWAELAEFTATKLMTELGQGADAIQRAQRLLDSARSDWERARAHHVAAMAEATRGQVAASRQHHERAVAYQQKDGTDELLALECRFGLAGSHLQLGEIQAGLDLARAALAEAETAPPGLRARFGFLIGQACSASGDSEGAVRAFDRALEEALEAEDRWIEARIVGQTGRVLSVEGDHAGALGCFERALALTRSHHDTVMTNALLVLLADAHVLMGAHEESAPFLEELLASCEVSGNLYYESLALCRLSHLEQTRGRYDAARDAALRAMEVADRAGNAAEHTRAILALGAVQRSTGDFDGARESFDAVLDRAREHDDRWSLIHALLDRAEVEFGLEQFEATIETATAALEITDYPKTTARAHGLLSRAFKAQSNFERALFHREQQHETEIQVERDQAQSRLEIARVQHEIGHARREAEAAVARVQADYRTLVEVSPTGIAQVDSAGRLLSINRAAHALFGPPTPAATVGTPFLEAIEEGSERNRVAKALERVWRGADEEVPFVGSNGRRYRGSFVPIPDSAGRVRRALVLCVDETDRIEAEEERSRLQEERFHSSRLEAIGRLAGGVAHDFNNYLTSLYFRPTLIRNQLTEVSPELEEQLGEMELTVQSAASLTQQLLAFSRKQLVRPRVLNANEVISRLDSMLRLSLPESVDFALQLESSLPPIRVDQGQLEQVVLNLVLNARDALGDGGRITLRTSTAEVAPDGFDGPDEPRVGPHVRIDVIDDGEGIDPEVLPHVFEPFFTTKERDRGTGLGLATVHGIVHQAKGHLDLDSEPGRGTTVSVFIPALDRDHALDSNGEKESEAAPGKRSGAESIVVCDDSEGVRSVAGQALRAEGYDVTICRTPRETLACADRKTTIDLLIADLVLPEMDGFELAASVRDRHPDTSVLYISGYSPDERVREQLSRTDDAFQEKPFSPEELLGVVRSMLDARVSKPST